MSRMGADGTSGGAFSQPASVSALARLLKRLLFTNPPRPRSTARPSCRSALSDPDQGDNRAIAGVMLEEIARTIGDTYTVSQTAR